MTSVALLPRIKSVAGLLGDGAAQRVQVPQHAAHDARPQPRAGREEVPERVPQAGLGERAAPVLVAAHARAGARLEHLHAAQPHPQRAGRAGGALRHLLAALLRRRVVSVLARAHL